MKQACRIQLLPQNNCHVKMIKDENLRKGCLVMEDLSTEWPDPQGGVFKGVRENTGESWKAPHVGWCEWRQK